MLGTLNHCQQKYTTFALIAEKKNNFKYIGKLTRYLKTPYDKYLKGSGTVYIENYPVAEVEFVFNKSRRTVEIIDTNVAPFDIFKNDEYLLYVAPREDGSTNWWLCTKDITLTKLSSGTFMVALHNNNFKVLIEKADKENYRISIHMSVKKSESTAHSDMSIVPRMETTLLSKVATIFAKIGSAIPE